MSQQNKTTLQSAINTQLADNTSGDISASDIRDNLINITDSLLFNTGSGQAITGSLIVTGGITGSLQGTATTASYVQTAQTASFLNVGTYSITSSWAVSASQALTSSRATSASYALSASYAPASSPYSVYTALLSLSSGTFTVTQLQNTIGDGSNTSPNDIQWSNPANGVLRGIKSGTFDENTKLIIFVPSLRLSGVSYFVEGGLGSFFSGSLQYAPTLNITKHDNDQTSTPNFNDLPIEIRVYN